MGSLVHWPLQSHAIQFRSFSDCLENNSAKSWCERTSNRNVQIELKAQISVWPRNWIAQSKTHRNDIIPSFNGFRSPFVAVESMVEANETWKMFCFPFCVDRNEIYIVPGANDTQHSFMPPLYGVRCTAISFNRCECLCVLRLQLILDKDTFRVGCSPKLRLSMCCCRRHHLCYRFASLQYYLSHT